MPIAAAMTALSPAERLDALRLARSETVGPISFRTLLRRFGTAGRALAALPELARRGGRTAPLAIPTVAQATQELELLGQAGARLVVRGEAAYPALLDQVEDAPAVLALKGDGALAERPCLAIVGARNASAVGLRMARELAAAAGQHGLVVVSGLARGIDGAAHRAALGTGTIGVVAGGIDVVYPAEHAELQAEIGARGLLAAEMPPGTEPQARHFPRRNRIIAGLSRGVLVVEAALKSGSLITARMAGEQGREVMAVPGSPLDPRARGANALLKQGAALIEGIDDLLAALGPPAAGPAPLAEPPAEFEPPREDVELERARARIVELLGPAPVEVDELIRQSGLTAGVVLTILLELELAGRLSRQRGGRVALCDIAAG
jgi:DNA processing protein